MGKSIFGFIAGIIAGSLAGILLAPDKGYITRKNLAKNSKKFAEEGIDVLKNLTNLSRNGNGHNEKEKRRNK
ncbi:MAG: YtxH domain-containing protein [Bacteroidetes bacterium]|nr:YtxH domain-containing protein [Bacteroidota bacterium]